MPDDAKAPRGLRQAAQERLAASPPKATPAKTSDELLHELQVHQIELEMQNEALRKSQIELSESRDRYRDLFDFAPVSYLVVGSNNLISEVNHAAAALMDRTRETLLGQRFSSFIVEDQRQQWREDFNNLLGRGDSLRCEAQFERRDGSRFYGRLHGVRLDEQGGIRYARLAVLNITDEKLAHQALLDEARTKDEFLAMLSHELRNPLAAIRSAASILEHVTHADDRLPWAQEIIERQVTHLARLLDDLLDVSRVARGAVTIRTQNIDLKSVIQHAVETMRPVMHDKGQQLDVKLSDHALIVNVDATRMTQVLINLLDNAAKYTPNGGKIDIAADLIAGQVHVAVRDNGIGIGAALLPKIFNLFQQGERGLDRRQGGLGIGLTLARQLVLLQGGQLTAKSAGHGKGSEFLLSLPLTKGEVEAPVYAPKVSAPTSIHRILMVDDDALVLATASVLLARGGHEIKTAHSARAALELLATYQPDLILLDIRLPDMDGYEAAREIRRVRPDVRDYYMVAVSGYGDENARKRSTEAGFDEHVVKPVDFGSLMAQVSKRMTSLRPN